MLCVEICSAAYVFDETMQTSVVNSLFGDGAAAVAVIARTHSDHLHPKILKFASHLIPDSIDAIQFDWDDSHGKFNFSLSHDVPYIIGAQVEQVIDKLLASEGDSAK
jgi:alkylresorcinol/alkylpyrone synthase/polyketide synthase Type III